jgi:hypothetical protein
MFTPVDYLSIPLQIQAFPAPSFFLALSSLHLSLTASTTTNLSPWPVEPHPARFSRSNILSMASATARSVCASYGFQPELLMVENSTVCPRERNSYFRRSPREWNLDDYLRYHKDDPDPSTILARWKSTLSNIPRCRPSCCGAECRKRATALHNKWHKKVLCTSSRCEIGGLGDFYVLPQAFVCFTCC